MPGDKMGFPPGIAESMVYQYFRKYQVQHEKRFPPKPETKKAWEELEKKKKEAESKGEKFEMPKPKQEVEKPKEVKKEEPVVEKKAE